jgi:hypothetical protein
MARPKVCGAVFVREDDEFRGYFFRQGMSMMVSDAGISVIKWCFVCGLSAHTAPVPRRVLDTPTIPFAAFVLPATAEDRFIVIAIPLPVIRARGVTFSCSFGGHGF